MDNASFTESVSADIRASIALPRESVLYQRLCGRNLGWIAVYGERWKIEKDAHERDPNVGLVEDW